MRLYYARHGQPAKPYSAMTSRSFADERNVHLGEEGILQAQELGKNLLGKGIQRIIASPFTRTTETAEHIFNVLRQENANLSFSQDVRLEEVRLGEEKKVKAFANLREWFKTGITNSEAGEAVAEVRTRIDLFLADLQQDPQPTCVVAHQSLGLIFQLKEAGYDYTAPVRVLQKSVKLSYCGLLEWELDSHLELLVTNNSL